MLSNQAYGAHSDRFPRNQKGRWFIRDRFVKIWEAGMMVRLVSGAEHLGQTGIRSNQGEKETLTIAACNCSYSRHVALVYAQEHRATQVDKNPRHIKGE